MTPSSFYTQDFSNAAAAIAAIFVILSVVASKILRLDLEKDFLVAAFRTTVQLIAIGFVLRWIFQSDSLGINLVVLFAMTVAAAQAVTARLKERSWKIYGSAFATLAASTWPFGLLSMAFFFSPKALLQTAFFVPFMGVLLGNTLSAISLVFLGTQRVRSENLLEIETLKALGATPLEACRRLYRDTLKQSLTPILNGMTVVGLVSLPGVMAGQVIGGVDPLLAARFQILVMFLILFAAVAGTLFALFLHHIWFMPKWLTESHKQWGFLIASGEKWALMGPSGIGKSRLLKSIVGLDKEEIRLNAEKNLSLIHREETRSYVYVHQKPHFVPGSVEENLRHPFQFRKHRETRYDDSFVKRFLTYFEIPQNILCQEASTLSGGEAQLIHLLRSLQLGPQVLLLDEPTASLDAGRTVKLEAFLNDWVQESARSLVTITHLKDQSLRFASKVIIFESGGYIERNTTIF